MLIDKRRDMARSVLPSTHRRHSAVVLDRIRRHHRRTVRQQLGRLNGPLDPGVVDAFDLGDDERFPNHLIHERVLERRSYDKVAPLIRWAVASTRTIRREDRLSHMAALLPANVIGHHALSHLNFVDEIAVDRHDRWHYPPVRQRHPLDDRDTLCGLLRRLIEYGEHGTLNSLLKATGSLRPVLDHHDVDAFVDHVLSSSLIWIRERRSWDPRDLWALAAVLEELERASD
jgi:hypothetical protein